MRRRNGLFTAFLILLCIAGTVGVAAFLRNEQELEQERQEQVAWLSDQLRPINEERAQWEREDKEWLEKLEEEKDGKPCVLLNFDSMNANVYDTIYGLMSQYGFRGTFAFKNGRLPGWEESDITREDFDDMMFSGWEYALSFGDEPENEEEVGYWERKQETEEGTGAGTGEAGAQAVQNAGRDGNAPEGAAAGSDVGGDITAGMDAGEGTTAGQDAGGSQDGSGNQDAGESQDGSGNQDAGGNPENEPYDGETRRWLDQLDDYIITLQDNGAVVPTTLFVTPEQYEKVTDTELAERGFTIACVKTDGEFPEIREKEGGLWRIDCGIYTQQESDIQDTLEKLISGKKSVALFINNVYRLSQDAAWDLSLTKFTSLLNYLKGLEEDGTIQILTWSELAQYEEQEEREYRQLVSEYSAFHSEMETAIQELNRRETELVDSLKETENEKSLAETKDTDGMEPEAEFQTESTGG